MVRLLHLAINSMGAKKNTYIKTLCWNAFHRTEAKIPVTQLVTNTVLNFFCPYT